MLMIIAEVIRSFTAYKTNQVKYNEFEKSKKENYIVRQADTRRIKSIIKRIVYYLRIWRPSYLFAPPKSKGTEQYLSDSIRINGQPSIFHLVCCEVKYSL